MKWIIALIPLLLLAGCVEQQPRLIPTTEPTPFCYLSNCGCKCQETPQDPNMLCGVNCLGEYGIVDCKYDGNKCVPVYQCTEETVQEDCETYMHPACMGPGWQCDNGRCSWPCDTNFV